MEVAWRGAGKDVRLACDLQTWWAVKRVGYLREVEGMANGGITDETKKSCQATVTIASLGWNGTKRVEWEKY